MKRITIVGAGNGGFAAAADLALRGFSVTLFEHPAFSKNLETIAQTGVIGLSTLPSSGLVGGNAKLEKITTDIREALSDTKLIFVVTPTFAHPSMAETMGAYLQKGQTIVLVPGGIGGSILFRKCLCKAGAPNEIYVGETSTLPYACRKLDACSVWIRGVKATFEVAAYPSRDTDRVLALVRACYPVAKRVVNIMETALSNLAPFIHPAVVLLNVGSIERKNRVLFYHEGITPSVQALIEGLDDERRALGEAFGLSLEPAAQVMLNRYHHQGAKGCSLREVAMSNPVYAWSEMPERIDTRYLTDDIPMGLMPLCALARQAGTPYRLMESIISIAEQLIGKRGFAEAKTLDDIDMAGLAIPDILQMLQVGHGGAVDQGRRVGDELDSALLPSVPR